MACSCMIVGEPAGRAACLHRVSFKCSSRLTVVPVMTLLAYIVRVQSNGDVFPTRILLCDGLLR